MLDTNLTFQASASRNVFLYLVFKCLGVCRGVSVKKTTTPPQKRHIKEGKGEKGARGKGKMR